MVLIFALQHCQSGSVLRANNLCRGNLGAKVYLLFAGSMFVVIAATWLFFPEVKGRTAAEVDEMFNIKLPARKFKGAWIGIRPPWF